MKLGMKIILAILFLSCSSLQAADLTIINFGGANGQAQAASMYQPWQKAQNSKVIIGEYNGEMAKIKAMVDAKQVTWDLAAAKRGYLKLCLLICLIKKIT